MATFSSDGVRIAFIDTGSATGGQAARRRRLAARLGAQPATRCSCCTASPPACATTGRTPAGWMSSSARGFRVIAMDNRGHGESEKLYDPAAYTAPIMAEDARRLLDHLGLARADVMGYSMGARITAFLALAHPERVRSAVFAGLGGNMVRPMAGTGPIAAALEAASIDEVKTPPPAPSAPSPRRRAAT